MTDSIGTLYLQTRTHSREAWSTLNIESYSSDLGFLTAFTTLENMKAGYIHDPRFTNHMFRIHDPFNSRH